MTRSWTLRQREKSHGLLHLPSAILDFTGEHKHVLHNTYFVTIYIFQQIRASCQPSQTHKLTGTSKALSSLIIPSAPALRSLGVLLTWPAKYRLKYSIATAVEARAICVLSGARSALSGVEVSGQHIFPSLILTFVPAELSHPAATKRSFMQNKGAPEPFLYTRTDSRPFVPTRPIRTFVNGK